MVALIVWSLVALLCWWVFADSDPWTVVVGLLFAGLYGRRMGEKGSSRLFLSFCLRLIRLLPRAYRQGVALICRGDARVRMYDEDLEGASEVFVLERIYLVTLTPDAVALGRDEGGRLAIHGLEVLP